MQVFQADRRVSELHGKQLQQRALVPCAAGCDGFSGVPANAGLFRSSFDILAAGIDLDLGSWL